jgi:hypothetical protein
VCHGFRREVVLSGQSGGTAWRDRGRTCSPGSDRTGTHTSRECNVALITVEPGRRSGHRARDPVTDGRPHRIYPGEIGEIHQRGACTSISGGNADRPLQGSPWAFGDLDVHTVTLARSPSPGDQTLSSFASADEISQYSTEASRTHMLAYLPRILRAHIARHGVRPTSFGFTSACARNSRGIPVGDFLVAVQDLRRIGAIG